MIKLDRKIFDKEIEKLKAVGFPYSVEEKKDMLVVSRTSGYLVKVKAAVDLDDGSVVYGANPTDLAYVVVILGFLAGLIPGLLLVILYYLTYPKYIELTKEHMKSILEKAMKTK